MKHKILKICTVALISFCILFYTYNSLFGCGYDYDMDDELTSFFNPKIINQPSAKPFFMSYHDYNNSYDNEAFLDSEKVKNLDAWVEYLSPNKITIEDIDLLIYKLNKIEFDTLYNYVVVKGKNFKQPQLKAFALRLKGSTFSLEVLDYLKFSKSIEPAMFLKDPWDYPYDYKKDTTQLHLQISNAIEKYKNCTEEFLKNRYAFQIGKMYFYLSDFENCKIWYEQHLKNENTNSFIKYRSLGYFAGALYHQKKYAESNYFYSIIFDQYPEGKFSAYESFHPWEDADWNRTIGMAKNNREKEVLWRLFGIYNDPIKGMKEIYAINPKSDLINLLLVRAINTFESYILTTNKTGTQINFVDSIPTSKSSEDELSYYYDTSNTNYSSAGSFQIFNNNTYYNELISIVELIANNSNTGNNALWYNASAYLNFLFNRQQKVNFYLQALENERHLDEVNLNQYQTTKALLYTINLKALNTPAEDSLADLLTTINNRSVIDFILSKVQTFYTNSNDTLIQIKNELCENNQLRGDKYRFYDYNETYWNFTADDKNTQALLNFMRLKKHNKFETFLLKNYKLKIEQIVEHQATQYIYNGQFKEAIAKFNEEKIESRYLSGNPFTIHIVDCHDCDHEAKTKANFTTYTFSQKMLEILEKANSTFNIEEKATNYFLYANGLYNMTHFGNARVIRDGSLTEIENYSKCKLAYEYYQKAMECSTNKEFKAKCAWMCAKCEQFDSSVEFEDEDSDKPYGYDFLVTNHFRLLKQKFKNTKYYQEIINECGYFCSYNGGGKKCIRNEY